jgi:hypothetical protein
METEFDTEIVVVGDDSMLNIDGYSIVREQKDAAKTDEALKTHAPSTEVKKPNPRHVEAKKTTMNAPRHRRRPKPQPPKPKSFWEKLVK